MFAGCDLMLKHILPYNGVLCERIFVPDLKKKNVLIKKAYDCSFSFCKRIKNFQANLFSKYCMMKGQYLFIVLNKLDTKILL